MLLRLRSYEQKLRTLSSLISNTELQTMNKSDMELNSSVHFVLYPPKDFVLYLLTSSFARHENCNCSFFLTFWDMRFFVIVVASRGLRLR